MVDLIIVVLAIYAVMVVGGICVSIWETHYRAKVQAENTACIYALYTEIKRYNDSLENQDG